MGCRYAKGAYFSKLTFHSNYYCINQPNLDHYGYNISSTIPYYNIINLGYFDNDTTKTTTIV
jgi:hypothetical protein